MFVSSALRDAGKMDIRARVSDESYDGWRYFAEQHGVSVASLVEAIGLTLRNVDLPMTAGRREMIARAREIDAQRRRRR